MSPSTPSRSSAAAAQLPAWRQWTRLLYLLAAGFIGVAVVVQVFFAGAAVLVDPTYWATHRAFGHTIDVAAIVLLLIGLMTRLPWRLQALGGLLYVLMFLQFLFLDLMPRIGVPLLRALHAVNALALFSVAVVLALHVRQHLRR
jgi:hypothetical protein